VIAESRRRVSIPCESFSAVAVMAVADAPTHLEVLVLKAIGTGADTLELLNKMFGIGARPMLRLVLDLLNRAWVSINFATGKIRLTARVVQALEEQRPEKLGGAERWEQRVTIMRDLVAGTILVPRREIRRGGMRVPPSLAAMRLDKVPNAEMLECVRLALGGKRTRAERPLQVIEVSIDVTVSGGAGGSGALLDLELEVVPTLDEASQSLKISVVYPNDLHWRSRAAIERKLTELANREDRDDVFKNLRQAAQREDVEEDKSAHEHLRELRDDVQRLQTAAFGTQAGWQERLEDGSRKVEEALASEGRDDLEIEILAGVQAQTERIRQLIGAAREQIVLACPFVSYEATWRFRHDIEAALGNGIRVFLLFGIGQKYELDTAVAGWLQALQGRFPDRLFFSQQSARCHAKFAAADGRQLLVTSYNYFSNTREDRFELAVHLSSSQGARPQAALVQSMLEVAAQLFPEYGPAQLLITDFEQGLNQAAPHTELQLPAIPVYDVDPELPFNVERFGSWKLDWSNYVTSLERTAAAATTTYQIVRDSEHKRLLYAALRHAKHHIVVISDQLSTRVIDRQFVMYLRICLARGVKVWLSYQRPEPVALEALDAVAADYPEFLSHARVAVESHAKALVWDDSALISSFNFLSFSGDYEGPEQFRMRAEIGVLLRGIQVPIVWQALKGIVSNLELDASIVDAGRPDARQAPLRDPKARSISTLFARLCDVENAGLAAGHPADKYKISENVRRWFSQSDSAPTAFLELRDLHTIGAPFLNDAIASCLSLYSVPQAEAETWQHWLNVLLGRLWREEKAYETFVLLRSSDTPSPSVPPRDIALLIADRTRRASSAYFEEVALAHDSGPGGAAVAAMAIEEVLHGGDPPIEALELLIPHLSEGLARCAKAAMNLRAMRPSGLSGLDLTSFTTVPQLSEGCSQAKGELEAELRRCVGLRPKFQLGQAAWADIVNSTPGLQRLLDAAERGDSHAAREFLRAFAKVSGDDVLDDAVKRVVATHRARAGTIISNFRNLSVKHLNRVVQLSRQWIDYEDQLAALRSEGADAAVTAFLGELRELLPALKRDAQALAAHERYEAVPLALLERKLSLLSREAP
jgi:phosphatidylserine/phosphatidylglycerophosphate/cardiolipin synthase-like enzyme